MQQMYIQVVGSSFLSFHQIREQKTRQLVPVNIGNNKHNSYGLLISLTGSWWNRNVSRLFINHSSYFVVLMAFGLNISTLPDANKPRCRQETMQTGDCSQVVLNDLKSNVFSSLTRLKVSLTNDSFIVLRIPQERWLILGGEFNLSKLLRSGFRYILKTYNNGVPSCSPDMRQIGHLWDVDRAPANRITGLHLSRCLPTTFAH